MLFFKTCFGRGLGQKLDEALPSRLSLDLLAIIADYSRRDGADNEFDKLCIAHQQFTCNLVVSWLLKVWVLFEVPLAFFTMVPLIVFHTVGVAWQCTFHCVENSSLRNARALLKHIIRCVLLTFIETVSCFNTLIVVIFHLRQYTSVHPTCTGLLDSWHTLSPSGKAIYLLLLINWMYGMGACVAVMQLAYKLDLFFLGKSLETTQSENLK